MAFRSMIPVSTLFLRGLLFSRRQSSTVDSANQQGLTLIECLVAIVVIAITVATITPPIFLATATRVQARRGEQANQIAQGEVDRVRQLIERGTYTITQLPSNAGTGAAGTVAAASSVGATLLSPAACSTYPPATPIASNALVPVDIDGDCKPEFAMQVYRTGDCLPASLTGVTPTPPPYAFDLGVRVYTYRDGETLPPLTTDRASLGLAAGKRDTGTTRRPMQVLYSRIARVNSSEALECSVPN